MEKVHLLRAAHQRREDHRGTRRPLGARWRNYSRLCSRLPGSGDRFWKFKRHQEPCRRGQIQSARLRASGRTGHAAAHTWHDLRSAAAESQPRAQRMKTIEIPSCAAEADDSHRRISTNADVTDKLSTMVLTKRTPLAWFFWRVHRIFAYSSCSCWRPPTSFIKGVGILGHQHPRWVGVLRSSISSGGSVSATPVR